jgi:hypothetical protein
VSISINSDVKGVETIEETNGLYLFDSNFLRIKANFEDSKINHLQEIDWDSQVVFDNNDQSFKIFIKPSNFSKEFVYINFSRI